jgi:hypothetical protein
MEQEYYRIPRRRLTGSTTPLERAVIKLSSLKRSGGSVAAVESLC